MRRWFVIAGIACAGCDASEPKTEASGVAEEPAQLAVQKDATQRARERIAARMDASGLALGPREDVTEALPFDVERIVEALTQATGSKLEAQWADPVLSAQAEGISFTFDAATGHVLFETALSYVDGLERATDAWFQDEASRLFAGLVGESSEVTVKHLAATSRDLATGTLTESGRLGTKVFAFRKLGGIPVAGNRLVASYLTDGRLKTVRGLWPRINLARSRLSSELSVDEVVARAADLLVEHRVNPDREEPIVLESFYELRPDAEGWVAVLRAAALVVTYGHENEPGRRERHDFDL